MILEQVEPTGQIGQIQAHMPRLEAHPRINEITINSMMPTRKSTTPNATYLRRATIAALNIAVPRQYRGSAATVGARVYKPNEDPKAILARLRDIYGRTTPAEKRANETLWSQNWNPADPIESLFMRLEECFVFALAAKPAYTEEQMVDKALMAIQSTGLY